MGGCCPQSLSPAITRSGKHQTRGVRFPPEILTPGEVEALISSCSQRAPRGKPQPCALHRDVPGWPAPGEALELRPKGVGAESGIVAVLRGNGGHQRTVGLDPGVIAIMLLWIDKRAQLGVGPNRPVFCTLAGGRPHQSYVRTLLPRLASKAGIAKRVHPHGLRHNGV